MKSIGFTPPPQPMNLRPATGLSSVPVISRATLWFDKLTTNGRGKGAVVHAVGDFPKDLLLEMKGKNSKRSDPVILASRALVRGSI